MSSDAPSVLLDLDGTLIDSLPGIEASVRAAFRTLGHELDPSLDMAALIGPPTEVTMQLLLAPFGDDRVAEAVAIYRADYGRTGIYDSHPYPGIAQALAAMKQSGARLYLATSKRRDFARRILDHLDLAALFDGIHGAEEGRDLDHKPELIADVIAQHALAPDRCVMVGDRRYDVIGAHANQMRAIGVLWGYGTRKELDSAGADDLVAEPAGLPAAVLAMTASGRDR